MDAVLLHSRAARFLRSLRRGLLPAWIRSADPPNLPSQLLPIKLAAFDAAAASMLAAAAAASPSDGEPDPESEVSSIGIAMSDVQEVCDCLKIH